jgi:hypothetical protein
LDFLLLPARVQGVEISDAVDTEHDSLAVNDKLPMPVLQRGLDDPGIAIGPVVAASGDQSNAIPLALQAI